MNEERDSSKESLQASLRVEELIWALMPLVIWYLLFKDLGWVFKVLKGGQASKVAISPANEQVGGRQGSDFCDGALKDQLRSFLFL